MDTDIPYLLLTPGPLSTSRTVREKMLVDSCTWDDDYNSLVCDIRRRLVRLATPGDDFTAVLMQGSGTFCVEATVGSAIPPDGKLLVVENGAYGRRITQMCRHLGIFVTRLEFPETEAADPAEIETALAADPGITHVAIVHCETTTGLLNPVATIGAIVKRHQRTFIVDAMSTFGGIPLSMEQLHVDYLVSSANKCIQGVPGFAYVIARRSLLEQSRGWARSLSLDLYDQWREMEEKHGKWRYTSPTHSVRAFAQALDELDAEGGVAARYRRYCANQRQLQEGMHRLGFRTLISTELQSPIITTFLYPDDPGFSFADFYEALKLRRFVIYPGKITQSETFRIATIGHVFSTDIAELLAAVETAIEELGYSLAPPTTADVAV